jgi:ABC-2 type transport system ATP-binding protein
MILAVKDLEKSFGKKEVLKKFNFEFENGKIYALLGRNGAGKTTFFNILNSDLKPDGGEICLTDGDTEKPLVPENISYVLSTPSVPAFLTGREFISFFIDVNKDKIEGLKDPEYYLDMVGIKEEDRDTIMHDYSHGMKSKMQILLNILADTDVMLLDEPLTSLDIVAAEDIKNLLRSVSKDRIIIFSTHIMELALTLCDETVILSEGKAALIKPDPASGKDMKECILEVLKEDE